MEEEPLHDIVEEQEEDISFSCMVIPYDDSFEYAAIMDIIRHYRKKHPLHHMKDIKVCDKSCGSHSNIFKLFWGKKNHHKQKYKLLFSIQSKYKTILQSFLGTYQINIQEIK
jgi:hypothetical protein